MRGEGCLHFGRRLVGMRGIMRGIVLLLLLLLLLPKAAARQNKHCDCKSKQ